MSRFVDTSDCCDLLTEAEVAGILRLTPGTLRQYRTAKRCKGKAPAYIQQGRGRVLYRREDINAWIQQHRTIPQGDSE